MKDQAEKLRIMMNNMRQTTERTIRGDSPSTRVICVSSGKGGVGKTNLTLNLGLALIDYGFRVLILDADMGMANIDVILGKVPPHNLYHVIRGEKTLDEVVFTGPKGIQTISGGSGIVELADLSAGELDDFITRLSGMESSADIFLIDTGAGISRNVLSYIFAADELLVVTTPEPTAITDAYGLIKSVDSMQRGKPISVVINRVDDDKEGDSVAKKLSMAVRQFLHRDIVIVGTIPDDPTVPKAVKSQMPFYLQNQHTPASLAVSKLAATLCNLPVRYEGREGITRMFRRMKSFFR
ncbi:AAA family ATPase [Heliobacterium gestii]|uniref:AAA family ATPase n=1 Tax=Heliomicrobium gestii TaxID=2699 RepID=A0A845LFT6_HELGE|nr:MinD/ParA family protein [Heliomicrobium gestii]MBM7867127.1 flagellar biosynthesis protein FlhG [Heliomicrobium gestii]MZP43459.1 AAA family ATPase [Heliomicrobium gestii]